MSIWYCIELIVILSIGFNLILNHIAMICPWICLILSLDCVIISDFPLCLWIFSWRRIYERIRKSTQSWKEKYFSLLRISGKWNFMGLSFFLFISLLFCILFSFSMKRFGDHTNNGNLKPFLLITTIVLFEMEAFSLVFCRRRGSILYFNIFALGSIFLCLFSYYSNPFGYYIYSSYALCCFYFSLTTGFLYYERSGELIGFRFREFLTEAYSGYWEDSSPSIWTFFFPIKDINKFSNFELSHVNRNTTQFSEAMRRSIPLDPFNDNNGLFIDNMNSNPNHYRSTNGEFPI